MPIHPFDISAEKTSILRSPLRYDGAEFGDSELLAEPSQLISRFSALHPDLAQQKPLNQWDALATLASTDLAAARMVEPHLDAQIIAAEAGLAELTQEGTWGVFAAERGGMRLLAHPQNDGSFLLDGHKPWCSLAAQLSHAIVSAEIEGQRQTFAVELTAPYVIPEDDPWVARGLQEIPSGSARFYDAPATAVGAPQWYLERAGFAWGGIRVSACWFGGALGMAQIALAKAQKLSKNSAAAEQLIGSLVCEMMNCRALFEAVAPAVESGADLSHKHSWSLALSARNSIYLSTQKIQQLSRELAGPAFLTAHPRFAKLDADLTVYLSQHHGGADFQALGELFLHSDSASENS